MTTHFLQQVTSGKSLHFHCSLFAVSAEEVCTCPLGLMAILPLLGSHSISPWRLSAFAFFVLSQSSIFSWFNFCLFLFNPSTDMQKCRPLHVSLWWIKHRHLLISRNVFFTVYHPPFALSHIIFLTKVWICAKATLFNFIPKQKCNCGLFFFMH